MKKAIALISVLLGVVFLAGCSLRPVSQIQPVAPAPAAALAPQDNPKETQTEPIKTYSVDEFVEGGFRTEKRVRIKIGSVTCYNSSCGFEDGGKWGIGTDNSEPFFQYAGEGVDMIIEADGDCPITAERCNSIKNVSIIGEPSGRTGPLSYSTTGVSATVSKTTALFGFTVAGLKTMADTDCGTSHEAGYFDKLVAKFSGTARTGYNFKYQGISQDDGIYTVFLLPNKAGYTSLDQFKKDFDICAAGGDAYPIMFNSDWLLFENTCGSGFDDGSGRPSGCDAVRKIVKPSLKLN